MNSKGLQKLIPDERDYSHHETFGTLAAVQLPDNDFTIYDSFQYTVVFGDTMSRIASRFGFNIADIMNMNPRIANINKIYIGQIIAIPARAYKILNQLDLDFCTAFATVELQNAIFGKQFDPLYQMAKIFQIAGSWSGYGANLRQAAASVIKYGSLPASQAPYTYTGQGIVDRNFVANYRNYPVALDIIAEQEEDLSYFAVDGPNDTFDNIRSILWQHKQERRAVSFGLFWHEAWTEAQSGIIPDVMPNDADGGGHDLAFVGQKMIAGSIHLVAQQTWSDTAGDKGFYYFPREIINASFREGYGAYTFSNQDNSGLKTVGGLLTSIGTWFNRLVGNI